MLVNFLFGFTEAEFNLRHTAPEFPQQHTNEKNSHQSLRLKRNVFLTTTTSTSIRTSTTTSTTTTTKRKFAGLASLRKRMESRSKAKNRPPPNNKENKRTRSIAVNASTQTSPANPLLNMEWKKHKGHGCPGYAHGDSVERDLVQSKIACLKNAGCQVCAENECVQKICKKGAFFTS